MSDRYAGMFSFSEERACSFRTLLVYSAGTLTSSQRNSDFNSAWTLNSHQFSATLNSLELLVEWVKLLRSLFDKYFPPITILGTIIISLFSLTVNSFHNTLWFDLAFSFPPNDFMVPYSLVERGVVTNKVTLSTSLARERLEYVHNK